jgi:hypothetical protein
VAGEVFPDTFVTVAAPFIRTPVSEIPPALTVQAPPGIPALPESVFWTKRVHVTPAPPVPEPPAAQLALVIESCGELVNDPNRPNTNPAIAMAAMRVMAMRMTVAKSEAVTWTQIALPTVIAILAISVALYVMGSPPSVFAIALLFIFVGLLGQYLRRKPHTTVMRLAWIGLFATWVGLLIFFALSALFVNTGIVQPSVTAIAVFGGAGFAIGGAIGDWVGRRRGYRPVY